MDVRGTFEKWPLGPNESVQSKLLLSYLCIATQFPEAHSIIFKYVYIVGPFANYLAVNTSFRLTTFVGGLLLGIGYGSSFFVTRLEFLFVTLGILAGNVLKHNLKTDMSVMSNV